MKSLIRAICVAAIALPAGITAVPAVAQLEVDPDLGTARTRSGAPDPGSRAPSIWLRGGYIQRDHWPVYRDTVRVNPRYHGGRDWARDAHEEWCYGTYRSYRAWDNTYKPHNGPRRRCHSPYG